MINIENENDLAKHCRILEGMKIGDVASRESMNKLMQQYDEREYIHKNIINDIIEQDYFKIPKNNSPNPDIKMADGDEIELKVSHLWLFNPKRASLVRPHYRLVIDMLDYHDVAKNRNWRRSNLYRKIKKMLIIYYYQDSAIAPWDWVITNAFIFKSSDYEHQIRRDYATIRNAILNGEKISERCTTFLANCPKHPGGFCWNCFDNSLNIRTSGKVPYKIRKQQLICSKRNHPRDIDPRSVTTHPTLGLGEKRGFCIPDKMMAKIWSKHAGKTLKKVGRSYGVPLKEVFEDCS